MRKLTLKYVKDYIERFEYNCLSKEYKNAGSKLELQCPEGHIYESTWAIFQQGYRCSKCAGNKKKTIEEVKEYIKQFGYTCLSEEYKGNFQKLKIRCSKEHIYKTSWSIFKQGNRCPKCKYINKHSGPNCHFWKGGISAEPYCDVWSDQDYKQSIKDRDRNVCLDPCCSKNSKRLAIHHIDYKKKNCHPLNLITLCNSCNGKANFDREWHTAWYQAIIYRRYNI